MTKLYLLLLAGAICENAFAQPTLNQANTAPVIGENFTLQRAEWDGSNVSLGANQTWNFASMTSVASTAASYIAPSAAPSPSSFPTATVATNFASTQYEFHKVNATTYERVGSYAGGVAIPLSNPEKMLNFPFAFNDVFTDPFGGTFVSGGATFTRAGTVTVTGAGWGTVMLPGVTYTNVLCVKFEEDYGDTYTGIEMYHYNTEIYMFYKPGIHIPVLALTHYEQGATEVNYANYYVSPSVSTEELDLQSFSVHPNPASQQLFINQENGDMEATEIYNLAGKLVFKSEGAIQSVDVSTFEKGIYLISFWKEGVAHTQKFIKD